MLKKKKKKNIKIPLIIGAPPQKNIPLLSGRGVSGHNGQSPSVVVDEGEDQGTVDSVFGVDCALVFTFIHDYRLQTLDGFDAQA